VTRVMHVWKDVRLYHGIHEQLQALARHIDKTQFEISICILGKRYEEIGRRFDELKVKVYYLDAEALQNPLLIVKLLKLFRAVRPDIVQTYCLNPNVFGGIAARWARVPVVIAGELTRNDQAPSGLQRFRDKLLNPVNNLISDRASCRIFVSEAVKLNWTGNRPSRRHRVIYPAYNVQRYEGSRSEKARNSQVIGIVARLSAEKRHIDLLCAMPLILEEVPDARLRVIGDGPLRIELKAKAAAIGIRDKVEFVGYVENSFVELNKLSVFVLPSRSEGFPISILEAMASGLPVVATQVGGIPEQVLDGQTGILVSPYQPAQIANAVVRLLKNPGVATEMGEKGKARVAEFFNVTRFVDSHEELYRTLMKR
jgi:glycosyltransferase involved in cell wall biosynthesis